MVKKTLLIIILALIALGGAFAQADDEAAQNTEAASAAAADENAAFLAMPKNAIAVDVMPMIAGSAISKVGNLFANIDADAPSTYVFGIAAHYERQISESFTLGARFSYMGGNLWYYSVHGDRLDMKVNTFSVEAHGRFYAGEVFFLDAMLGYANMTTAFSGSLELDNGFSTVTIPISPSISRDFFLMGAKLGWRIDFGKPGGFIFEPALAWNFAIGGQETVGKKFAKATGSQEVGDGMELLFLIYENFLFVGGPRFCLSGGWRF